MVKMMKSAYSQFPALVLVFCPFAFAGLNLSIEPGIGYKTNVPSLSDSIFGNYPYASMLIDPECTFNVDRNWNGELAVDAEYSRYFHGATEWNIDPAVVFSRNAAAYTASMGLSAGYYVTAGGYDPTIPRDYGIVSFSADYSMKKLRQPVTLYYSLAMVDDAGSDRMDYRNSVKCKMSWKPGSGKNLFIKPGILWAVSNDHSTSYVQPLISGGASRTVLIKNVIIAQAYIAYPFYGTVTMNKKGKGNGKTRPETTVAGSLENPRVPHTLINAGYIREIAAHLDFSINYNFFMLDPGTGRPLYISHGVCLSLEYGMEHLLPFDKKDRK